MTQPIQEPATQRSIGALQWGQNQLFRRPDPNAGGGTSVVHMFAWNYDSDNTVPTDTWTDVASLGSGGGFFEEVFYSPTDPGLLWDCTTGEFALSELAEYTFHAWIQYAENAQIDNEKRLLAVKTATSDRMITEFTFDIADGNEAATKLQHSSFRLLGFGSVTYSFQVWQNSGGDLTIVDAEFLVRRHEFVSAGVLEPCAS